MMNQKAIPPEVDDLRLAGIEGQAVAVAHHGRDWGDPFQTRED